MIRFQVGDSLLYYESQSDLVETITFYYIHVWIAMLLLSL